MQPLQLPYLQEVVTQLAYKLNLHVPTDLNQPQLIIEALRVLFPQTNDLWDELGEEERPEVAWSVIIQFLESNVLDGSNSFAKDITEKEICQIYLIILELFPEQEGSPSRMSIKYPQDEAQKLQKPQKQQKRKEKFKENKKNQNQSKNKKEQKALQGELLDTVNKAIQKANIKKDPKTCPLMRDKAGFEAVEKAKRQFDYTVKQMKRKQNKKYPQQKMDKGIDPYYLKVLRKKQEGLEQEVITSQLKYYLDLRDRKVNFIRHTHKLIEKLQKERQIDLHKKQRNLYTTEKGHIHGKIEQADQLFENNMDLIRQQFTKNRQQNQLRNYQALKLAKEIETNVTKKKKSELDNMKTLWEQESAKLVNIVGDEEHMKQKLLTVYRKNRV